MSISYQDIIKNEEINQYISMEDEVLGRLGYTEHSRKHAAVVADRAAEILRTLDYSKREIELARITGYLHDIGNCVNRHDHAHSGAVMAFQILRGMKFQPEDIAIIVSAIGNHDEATGTAVTPVSAAVIIADKTDVRANRVRNTDIAFFDKHDRVNYAAIKTKLTTDAKKKVIHLNIKLDEQICSVLDYFEIFTDRMLMSRRAAEILGLKFKFTVNGNKVL